MSFLDDLKRQAHDLQAVKSIDHAALARNTALAEAAATEACRYLAELAKHLEVIRPVSTTSYQFDAKTRLTGGQMEKFRFDARRKRLRELDLTDHIAFGCVIRATDAIVLKKNFVPEIEKLEARLWQSGASIAGEPVRDSDSGRLIEMKYEFVPEVWVGLKIVPNHDLGLLRFRLSNIDGLETVECEFAPHEIGQRRLDELARWWLGQPHRFLDGASDVRRIEVK